MKSTNSRFASKLWLLPMIAFCLVTIVGCISTGEKNPRVLIPEEDTARDQFAVAERQFVEANGIYDLRVRQSELRKAIIAYQAVEDRYPTDDRYTPAAAAIIAEIYRDLEDYRAAERQYRHVLARYSADRDVHIEALIGLGKTLDDLGRPGEAQTYYKLLIDQYSGISDPMVRGLVEEARIRYRQIRLIEG